MEKIGILGILAYLIVTLFLVVDTIKECIIDKMNQPRKVKKKKKKKPKKSDRFESSEESSD
jgi:hypothetical protein